MKSVAMLAASVALLASNACTHSSKEPPSLMDMTWCDTRPMTPIGRVARIPVATPSPNRGTLTGVVVQRETEDALAGVGVRLAPIAGNSARAYVERWTNDDGGFSFDSIPPGRYQIHTRRIGEYQDTTAFEAASGRVDTITIAMRANRCYGY